MRPDADQSSAQTIERPAGNDDDRCTADDVDSRTRASVRRDRDIHGVDLSDGEPRSSETRASPINPSWRSVAPRRRGASEESIRTWRHYLP
jgi:hypothetical protein